MGSKFEVYKSKDEKWRFRLKAGNGEIICDSQGYKTKNGCLKGLTSVQKNAGKAIIDIQDERGVTTGKKVVKELVKMEKRYKDKKFPVLKTVEEVEDEVLTVQPPKSSLKFRGPSWL